MPATRTRARPCGIPVQGLPTDQAPRPDTAGDNRHVLATWRLDEAGASPSRARAWVRGILDTWDPPADGEVVEAAQLVASELLTNAVRYAGGTPALSLAYVAAPAACLLRVEVHDDAPLTPALRRTLADGPTMADVTQESGRGLALVRALTGNRLSAIRQGTGKALRADLVLPDHQPSRARTPGDGIPAPDQSRSRRSAQRRQELRTLLRAWRERRDPAQLGITDTRRRRRPGVHQDELAAVLHVSTRRYYDIEHGVTMPDFDQLDRLADLLALTQAERSTLHLLATGHQPVAPFPTAPGLAAEITSLVDHLDPHPAIVTSPAGDYWLWNQAWTRWFHNPEEVPPGERNVLLWILSEAAAERYADIAGLRENAVGRFRAAYAQYPDEPRMREVLARVQRSPDARRLWQQHLVTAPLAPVSCHIRHPTTGEVQPATILSSEFPTGAHLVTFLIPDPTHTSRLRDGDLDGTARNPP